MQAKNVICISALLLFSCKSGNDSAEVPKSKDFFQIDFESAKERNKVEYLSDLASGVDYIQLETSKNCIINPNADLFLVTDSLIFVNNLFYVLIFSRDGKFLKQISEYGRGPGENEGILSISVIPRKKLLAIQSQNKMLFYSFNGDFIESVKTPQYIDVLFTADDRFVAYFDGNMGNESYDFLLTDLQFDTIAFVENHFKWKDNVEVSFKMTYPYFKPFYRNTGRYYMKSMYNDTVYYISENKVIPGYCINLGKHKMPPEWRPEKILTQDREKFELLFQKESECYYCNTFESADWIFVTFVNFRTRKPDFFLLERGSADQGHILINENREPAGIINDLDGGMDFWPDGKIDDKHLFMSLKPRALKQKLDQIYENHSDKKAKYEQEKFKKMVSDIDILANPVLMIVSLKD